MRLLSQPLTFDWDDGNSEKNATKHNVSNKEAEEVFDAQYKFIFTDPLHSRYESRYMIWGVSNNDRKLAIFFTIRKNKVRVISARDMSKQERSEYAKKIKKNTNV